MKRLIFLAALVAGISPAYADTTYDFTGAINYGAWRGYGIGTPITGWFTIASGLAPNESPANSSTIGSYDALLGMAVKVGGYTFSMATGNWMWTIGDGELNGQDFQASSFIPVSATDAISGEANIGFTGDGNTFDGVALETAATIDRRPWTTKGWGLEIYDLGVNAAMEVSEIGGNIFQTIVRPPQPVASIPSHDKYGTRIGTIKDGYPIDSDY